MYILSYLEKKKNLTPKGGSKKFRGLAARVGVLQIGPNFAWSLVLMSPITKKRGGQKSKLRGKGITLPLATPYIPLGGRG